MPLHIVRNDITRMDTDAIVNAAKNSLLGGGGVDGAIHRAAGPGLLEECRTLGGCATGQAKITKGYNLDAKYVIHTVGPVWQGGNAGERELLQSCYTQSLNLAKEYRCKTVAFPLISTGVYGYPKDLAITAAVDAIGRWLAKNDMTVYLVIFDNESHLTGKKLYRDIKSYIDDNYAERHSDTAKEKRRRRAYESVLIDYSEDLYDYRRNAPLLSEDELYAPYATPVLKSTVSLEEYIKQLDEGFSGTLLSLIEEKGMTHSQCYKKANISRKHFSKIRNNPGYHPAKTTVLAFAIALELSLEQTEELLKKAGYALSHADVGDLIIEYFIKNGNYDIFKLNNALYDFDQPLLGL